MRSSEPDRRLLRDDALIATRRILAAPWGCQLGNAAGVQRIKDIRHLDDKHHFTLVCHDLAQLSQFVQLSNPVFLSREGCDTGPLPAFILPATREVPVVLSIRRSGRSVRVSRQAGWLRRSSRSWGAADVQHPDPAGREIPMSEGWEVQEELGQAIDAVVDAGSASGTDHRRGPHGSRGSRRPSRAGDPSPFE